MVKTRVELKLKIGEWIDKQENPFPTNRIQQEIVKEASNIRINPNRLVKYVQATGKVKFDKKSKMWSLKPLIKLNKNDSEQSRISEEVHERVLSKEKSSF